MLRELLVANEYRAGIFAEWRGMQSGAPETRCCCTSSKKGRRPLRSSPAGFVSHPWRCVSTSTHCPVCAAAAACPSLCRDELSVFKTAIGKGIPVERVEYILAGGRRCAYRIGRTPDA